VQETGRQPQTTI
jgi:hypothetical protein